MSTDLGTSEDSAPRPRKRRVQGETLHPGAAISQGNSQSETTEVDKAVLDVPPAAPQYSDVILYLRGGESACWVYGETVDEAHALFKEYAEADGVAEEADGPVPGDRVLKVHVDPDDGTRVLLLSPFQHIVRKVQA